MAATPLYRVGAVAVAAALTLGLVACGDDSKDSPPTVTQTIEASIPTTAGSATSDRPSSGPLTATIDAATVLAAAKRSFIGELTEIALKHHNGALVYDIELVSDHKDAEVIVDATSGAVTSVNEEDNNDDGRDEVFTLDGLLGAADAQQRALARVPGGVDEWKLERDNGRIVYTVEIHRAGTNDDSADVKLDAKSGEIIEVDD